MTITASHWHLLVNHIPIIGVPMIAILLVWGLATLNAGMVRLALLATVVMAGAVWLATTTGDNAKDELREAKYTWVSRHLIHDHEEAADKAQIAGIATGVLALAVLVMARGGKTPDRRGLYVVLVGLVATTGLLAWTGWKGGDIRHDEFGMTPAAERIDPPGELPREE
ncbi:MAG: hypothetical protein ABJC19_11910 [Gemmatimonadota bacterium]